MVSQKEPHQIKSIVTTVRHFLRFRSIQQKIGVYAFSLSLLAVSGVSIFSYWIASKQIAKDREKLMTVQARQTSQNLIDELNNLAEDLQLWREIRYIHTSLKEPRSEHDADTFFDAITSQREKKYDFLLTINREGRICAINSLGKNLIGKSYQALLTSDMRSSFMPTTSWFQDSIKSGSLHTTGYQRFPVINDLYKRRADTKQHEELYQIGLAIAVQDEKTKEALGVIVAIINWSHFQSLLDRVEKRFAKLDLKTGYAFLTGIDRDTLIGHKHREEYGQTASGYQILDLYKAFQNRDYGIISYTYKGNKKTVALEGVSPPELSPQIDWVLGVGINDDEIFYPIQKLKLRFSLISLMIAVLVGAISLLFGRAISVSLGEFTQLARDASRGSFVKMAKTRSHDELGNLAQAFNEMLVSFRAQMPFVNIPNPYVVGTPLRTSTMFYGRQGDLNWVGDRLEHAGNIMIVLYGARRVGKTSLLHQINGGRASDKVLPFFFDTQQLIPEIAQDIPPRPYGH